MQDGLTTGKATSNNEKRKRKKERLKHKMERKDKKRSAKMVQPEYKRSKFVINHVEGPGSEIDNEEDDCEVTIKSKRDTEFTRNEVCAGGKIKNSGKRNKLTVKVGSERSSSRQTSSSEEDSDESCVEETNRKTLSAVKPSTSTPGKSGSKTLGGKVHITLRSTEKKQNAQASFGETDKVGDSKEEIKGKLKEKGEILLYKNGKEINESKSFAENGIKTNDIIEVKVVALCSVGGSGNEGRHCVR